ncbi:transcriptional regulator [Rhodobacteraceae bacterium EhC02]|jgi:DNA-binding HxlR family transcriptional regulator|nr:transcriptional regulator [Rhodobacteraceae bacterium EhC02]
MTPAELAQRLRDGALKPDVMSQNCPSRRILQHVTSRWGTLVLVALEPGTQRFSTLRRRIGGISERMLAQTLQQLESDGLVHRHAHDVVPPHVDYTLTPLGRDLAPRLLSLAIWIEDHLADLLQSAPTAGASAAPTGGSGDR